VIRYDFDNLKYWVEGDDMEVDLEDLMGTATTTPTSRLWTRSGER
jgi:hypothetical protein